MENSMTVSQNVKNIWKNLEENYKGSEITMELLLKRIVLASKNESELKNIVYKSIKKIIKRCTFSIFAASLLLSSAAFSGCSLKANTAENYILVSGNIPGAKNSLVLIRSAVKNSRKKNPKEIYSKKT